MRAGAATKENFNAEGAEESRGMKNNLAKKTRIKGIVVQRKTESTEENNCFHNVKFKDSSTEDEEGGKREN